MSAHDFALSAIERDGRMLALMEKLNRPYSADIEQLHAELAEIRDDMTTLSNRIEAVTRAVGGGLHSVPSCDNPSCVERGVDRHRA